MKRAKQAAGSADKKTSLRMKRFIESVIEEVEEAGIDDEHAVDESEPTSQTTDGAALARIRRQQSL